MHPADMNLRPFIEDARSDALQRARLAQELNVRRGDARFACAEVAARREAANYAAVLRRLNEDEARTYHRSRRFLQPADAAGRRLPNELPMRLIGTAAVIGLCLFVFAVIYGLEAPVPASHLTVARRAATHLTSRAVPATSAPAPAVAASADTAGAPQVIAATPSSDTASALPQAVGPSADTASTPPQSAPDLQEAASEGATVTDLSPTAYGPPSVPPAAAEAQPIADSSPSGFESVAMPEPPPAPADALTAPALPSSPDLVTTQMVRSNPFTGTRVVTQVVGQYCQDSSGGQIFTPINAPAPGLTC